MGFVLELIAIAWMLVAAEGTVLTLGLYFNNGSSQLTQTGVLGCVALWTLSLVLLIANKIMNRPTKEQNKQ